MNSSRLFWALAVAGMRTANAFAFIFVLALTGSLLGWIQGHPALAVWLIVPLLAVLIFENLWLTGRIRRASYSRLGAVTSVVVLGVAATQLAAVGGNGLLIALFALLGFAGLMAIAVFFRPVIERL